MLFEFDSTIDPSIHCIWIVWTFVYLNQNWTRKLIQFSGLPVVCWPHSLNFVLNNMHGQRDEKKKRHTHILIQASNRIEWTNESKLRITLNLIFFSFALLCVTENVLYPLIYSINFSTIKLPPFYSSFRYRWLVDQRIAAIETKLVKRRKCQSSKIS